MPNNGKRARALKGQARSFDATLLNEERRNNDKARIDRSTRLRERERMKRIQLQRELQGVSYE